MLGVRQLVVTASRRPLNEDELIILRMIQEAWGPQNTEAEVFFMEDGSVGALAPVFGAWIFAKAPDGTGNVAVNLTNTGAWYKDETYSYDDVRRAIRGPNWSESQGS
jgi:hypothetical protein